MIVREATARLAQGVEAPEDTPQEPQAAVMEEASERSGGTMPVKPAMTSTQRRVRDAGTRFIAGALAGANKMAVSVDVIDANNGTVIGRYDVQRRANPGGYGMLYDQAEATIKDAPRLS